MNATAGQSMITPRADIATIADGVESACRAPSIHNSQPWRWVADRSGLQLYLDTDRLVATDHADREALLSCGAALDHLRVAMAARGWAAHADRYPDPDDQRHLATVDFTPLADVTDRDSTREAAIGRRRTDRLPLGAPADWDAVEAVSRGAVDESVAMLDVVDDAARPQLAEAAQLSESLRLYDSEYHAELAWWTGPLAVSDGIPHSSLISAAESDRVDIGRNFPVTHDTVERRMSVPEDRAKVLVISARGDSPSDILGCGEMLSQVLLAATAAGLATCTLTHLTETRASRDIISALVGRDQPQLLIRVGTVPALEDVPPPTPRRRPDEVFEMRL